MRLHTDQIEALAQLLGFDLERVAMICRQAD